MQTWNTTTWIFDTRLKEQCKIGKIKYSKLTTVLMSLNICSYMKTCFNDIKIFYSSQVYLSTTITESVEINMS